MAVMSADPRRDDAPLLPILLATAAISCGVGLIFPLLAEFQDRYGFSAVGLGLISASTFISALIAGVGLAQLADRGRARALLVVGLVGTACSLVWFSFATELWQFVGARAVEGLAAGVFIPAARAWSA